MIARSIGSMSSTSASSELELAAAPSELVLAPELAELALSSKLALAAAFSVFAMPEISELLSELASCPAVAKAASAAGASALVLSAGVRDSESVRKSDRCGGENSEAMVAAVEMTDETSRSSGFD